MAVDLRIHRVKDGRTINAETGICTIVSLVPFEINSEKPGLSPGKFIIPKSDTKEPTLYTIGSSFHFMEGHEGMPPIRQLDPAPQVANSIVYDFKAMQLGFTETAYPGLFWVNGEVVDKKDLDFKELDKNKEAQHQWFLRICRIADDDFRRYQQHNVVSDFQRQAARIIGWSPKEYPWMSREIVQESMQDCSACGTSVKKGIVICPQCKYVLDKDKYKTLQFAAA